jgi:hypothetical protein
MFFDIFFLLLVDVCDFRFELCETGLLDGCRSSNCL